MTQVDRTEWDGWSVRRPSERKTTVVSDVNTSELEHQQNGYTYKQQLANVSRSPLDST